MSTGPKKPAQSKKTFFLWLNLQVLRNSHGGSGEKWGYLRGLPHPTFGSEISEWNEWEVIAPAGSLRSGTTPISDYTGPLDRSMDLGRTTNADHLSLNLIVFFVTLTDTGHLRAYTFCQRFPFNQRQAEILVQSMTLHLT